MLDRLSKFFSCCGTSRDICELCSNLLGLISFYIFFNDPGMFISAQASLFSIFFPGQWVIVNEGLFRNSC